MKVPSEGFPENGSNFQIELSGGSTLTTDMIIMATGQKPNNSLVAKLAEKSGTSLLNTTNGCILVKPTLQLKDDRFPNIFSLGDIADTGSHKAARPGAAQAGVVARNIASMIQNEQPAEIFTPTPAAIHLSLGLVSIQSTICQGVLEANYYTETQHHLP